MAAKHYSDCAINNAPAYKAGKCNCGGFDPNSTTCRAEAMDNDPSGAETLRNKTNNLA